MLQQFIAFQVDRDNSATSMTEISCMKILKVSAGQKFPETVSALLERLLYSRGMTGWGEDHADDIDVAILALFPHRSS